MVFEKSFMPDPAQNQPLDFDPIINNDDGFFSNLPQRRGPERKRKFTIWTQ
jgi:hypothetical protein